MDLHVINYGGRHSETPSGQMSQLFNSRSQQMYMSAGVVSDAYPHVFKSSRALSTLVSINTSPTVVFQYIEFTLVNLKHKYDTIIELIFGDPRADPIIATVQVARVFREARKVHNRIIIFHKRQSKSCSALLNLIFVI